MAIPIIPALPESLEQQAYALVADIETKEPNDRYRLGYNIFLYMSHQHVSLAEAIAVAQARTTQSAETIYRVLAERLREKGFSIT